MPLKETESLVKVVRRLREKCPWDRKQTHKSLVPYLIEEAYEAAQALETGKKEEMVEELGDVLLQVVLHSAIAEQKKIFRFEDVARAIREKMIRRHPHLFGKGGKKVRTAAEQTKNWSQLKSKEKPKKSLLAGIPVQLPALLLAQRYGNIAASVGFDWKKLQGVIDKVKEELSELMVEIERTPRKRNAMELELGDLLFTLTRLAAHLDLDAERALRQSSKKFQKRFDKMETVFRKKKKTLSECSLEEMDAVWNQLKRQK